MVDLEEIFTNLGILLLMLVILFVPTYFISIVLGNLKCDAKSVSFEDHKYTFFGGCMVKHEGKWLPLENIRGID